MQLLLYRYRDPTLSVDRSVEDLLERTTLEGRSHNSDRSPVSKLLFDGAFDPRKAVDALEYTTGEYELRVGHSSTDVRERATVDITGEKRRVSPSAKRFFTEGDSSSDLPAGDGGRRIDHSSVTSQSASTSTAEPRSP
ncbi:hypothetical protein AB7C87_04195 [Natrarchaeobius sp. A-rgal3]|uniref:hypothetical protein n=1 Tax=Natrarchaeobius versutus TaxID=1679078 RepID=UPI00350F5E7E